MKYLTVIKTLSLIVGLLAAPLSYADWTVQQDRYDRSMYAQSDGTGLDNKGVARVRFTCDDEVLHFKFEMGGIPGRDLAVHLEHSLVVRIDSNPTRTFSYTSHLDWKVIGDAQKVELHFWLRNPEISAEARAMLEEMSTGNNLIYRVRSQEREYTYTVPLTGSSRAISSIDKDCEPFQEFQVTEERAQEIDQMLFGSADQ